MALSKAEWSVKIRETINRGLEKGLRVQAIGENAVPGWWVHLPDGTKKRFAGPSRLIEFIDAYKPVMK